MAYDQQCYELAEHLMDDSASVRQVSELAQHIQDSIEAWLSGKFCQAKGEIEMTLTRDPDTWATGEKIVRPTVKYRTLADLVQELRAALRTAKSMPCVDASYSKGLQDGLQIAIDFAEKRKRPSEI